MKIQILILAALLSLLPGSGISQESVPPSFRAGDRWCALGDSITEGGGYHKYVELFLVTRALDTPIEVINCGIRGDTAAGANQRFTWDCLNSKPTVVSVMFGMNDIGRSFYKYKDSPDFAKKALDRAEAFERDMRALTCSILDSGAKVILIKPSIFDDTADLTAPNLPGCGDALAGYGKVVGNIGADHGLPVVDFDAPMRAINEKEQKRDPSFSIVGPDRVHPTAPGHFVMAYEFLKSIKVTGIVSKIGINAAVGTISRADNCTVSDLKSESDDVSFECLENALPFPVEDGARPALNYVPFTRDLNQQILQVDGLKAGNYELSIDGRSIRIFTSAQLAQGVNLAEERATPQYQQAEKVLAALRQKWNAVGKLRAIAFIEHNIWPDAARPLAPTMISAELDAGLDKITGENQEWKKRLMTNYLSDKKAELGLHQCISNALESARQMARPSSHVFLLRPHQDTSKSIDQ